MSRGNELETNDVNLPFSFDVQPFSSNSKSLYPISITIIRSLQNININNLSSNEFAIRPIVFKLQDNIVQLISKLSGSYFLSEIKEKSSDKYSNICLVYRIYGTFFALSRLSKETKIQTLELKYSYRIPDVITEVEFFKRVTLIPKKEVEIHEEEREESIINRFSMKIPNNFKYKRDIKEDKMNNIISPQQLSDDPLIFLKSRYYNLLYSLNTPLTYFPKTGLSRFKILCENSSEEIKNILMKVCLSIDTLDNRYKSRVGVLRFSLDSIISACPNTIDDLEISNQLEFLKKNPEIQSKLKFYYDSENYEDSKFIEKLNIIILELKIREAQLQMIIILELICSWGINEEDFFANIQEKEKRALKKKIKQSKQSLIRKKSSKTKRKIMPTFLGMGIHIGDSIIESITGTTEMDLYDLFRNLNTYIDRIRLWDTLLGRNLETKDDNLFGFLAYVLLPFYNKRIPKILKHIVSRVKSMGVKSSTKQKLRDTAPLTVNESFISNIVEGSAVKDTVKDKGHINRPLLKRKSLSMTNNKDLLPAFSLKRSKSNLSSKNFQKRQVDMSLNLKSFNEKQVQIEKTSSKQINEIDNVARQRSVTQKLNQEDQSNSISQVEATPVKQNSKNSESVPYSDNMNILPTNPRTISSNQNIFRTKSTNINKKKDIPLSEKLLLASNEPFQDEIILSPMKNTNIIVPLANRNAQLMINETPKEIINSSPISIKSSIRRGEKKPGTKAFIEDSPFYSASLSGSPVSVNVKRNIPSTPLLSFNDDVTTNLAENKEDTIYSPTKQKKATKVYFKK